MQVFITPIGNGYQVTILGEKMPDFIGHMANVAPHLSFKKDEIDVKIPRHIYLEKVASDTINPEVKTISSLFESSAAIILLILMYAKMPEELESAQITALGDYSVKSTENGIGFLTIVNGKLSFSPLYAQRKYPGKDWYVITTPENFSKDPSFTNADFMREPIG